MDTFAIMSFPFSVYFSAAAASLAWVVGGHIKFGFLLAPPKFPQQIGKILVGSTLPSELILDSPPWNFLKQISCLG